MRKYVHTLVLLSVIAFLHFLANVLGIYDAQIESGFVWIDNLLHGLVGVTFGFLWLRLLPRYKSGATATFKAISTIVFVAAVATLWEFIEYVIYFFFTEYATNLKVYSPSIGEAAADTISNVVGGLSVLLITRRKRTKEWWANFSEQRKRIVYICLSIGVPAVIIASLLYGLPPSFQIKQLRFDPGSHREYEPVDEGQTIYEPLREQFLGDVFGIPPGFSTYRLQFGYFASSTCVEGDSMVAFIRLSVPAGNPFVSSAKKSFDDKSCEIDPSWKIEEKYHGENGITYNFCIPQNTAIELEYPADEPLNIDGTRFNTDCVSHEQLTITATPLWREWLIGWFGSFLICMLVVGGFLTILSYIRRG